MVADGCGDGAEGELDSGGGGFAYEEAVPLSCCAPQQADARKCKVEFLIIVTTLTIVQPTAVVGLATFIPAYVQRDKKPHDLPYWLLFLLIFIWNTVFSVMNAYNNITWESDRMKYEDGEQPFRIGKLAILGIPSPKQKQMNGKEREGKEI